MKKKVLIPIIVVVVLLLLCAGALLYMASHSLGFSTGRILIADNDSYMLILDNFPIVLSNPRQKEGLFDDLSTGDKVRVLHDWIRESYPGGTAAYAVSKLESGSMEDIPQSVIDTLSEMGWLNSESDPVPPPENGPVKTLGTTVSWVNWTDDSSIYFGALNRDKMQISSVLHVPIYKFDTKDDLDHFQSAFRSILSLECSYGEAPSFLDATAKYDEAFFEENSLMLVYVTSGSGSDRFGVKQVCCDNGVFWIQVEQTNNPEIGTCDMAGWFITVAVPDSVVAGCTEFDAFF